MKVFIHHKRIYIVFSTDKLAPSDSRVTKSCMSVKFSEIHITTDKFRECCCSVFDCSLIDTTSIWVDSIILSRLNCFIRSMITFFRQQHVSVVVAYYICIRTQQQVIQYLCLMEIWFCLLIESIIQSMSDSPEPLADKRHDEFSEPVLCIVLLYQNLGIKLGKQIGKDRLKVPYPVW